MNHSTPARRIGQRKLAPAIERSWQRCVKLGLHAQQTLTFDPVSGAQMRRMQEANAHLVSAARPILHKLGRALADTHCFAMLTNHTGVVIDVSGVIDAQDPRLHRVTRIGTDLCERSVGTTAISVALAELQPVRLHRGEHFFTDTQIYSCAAAPVFGVHGECVGALDVTGVDVPERAELKHLVTHYAQRIENAWVRCPAHSLLLRLNWPGCALGCEADGMVCLDADGWVTAANQPARQMLPSLTRLGHAQTLHASELFGVAHARLFDAVRRPGTVLEIALPSRLKLQVLPIARDHEDMPVYPAQRLPGRDSLRVKEVQATLIRQAMAQARGNVSAAAQTLGISRATLYRKLGKPQ